jgi:hypothetical protein
MKDLVLVKRENLGLAPEVVGYLASIKESDCAYRDLNVRHPGGVFELASSQVVKDFLELLNELDEHQMSYEKDRPVTLEKKFRDLIMDFFKFHESCYEVIVGCCKKHAPPKDDYLSKWLNNNYYTAGRNFHDDTINDQEYLKKIYNKLKHTSSLLRSVNFNRRNTAIMGFFIQGTEDGIPGPDKDIHPKHHGQYTGISYNFALRELYYVLYKVSYVLKKVVLRHFKEVYNLDLEFNREYKINKESWDELFEKMSKLPRTYFPNEFGKKTFEFRNSNSKLIFYKRPAETTDLNGFMTHMLTTGDGFTRSFRIPYFGGSVRSNQSSL